MGRYDDDKKGGLFPTRTGPAIGASKERGMLDNIGGSDSFRTKIWNQPDGSTTRLKTKNGMPEFITEGAAGKEEKPCTDFLIKQEKAGDTLSSVKAMLRTNPNERYGKQIGAALFTDSISATPEVDVATTNTDGLKNFSLPAAEGDTYLVRFPWATKDILLFGRDRHYCPFPKSSVKVGYLRWPCGILRDGTKHVFVLEVRITWSCDYHFAYAPSFTKVEVFDAEAPSVILYSRTFDGVYGTHATLNHRPDGVFAALSLTATWLTLNNWNSDDHPEDPTDPDGPLILEFEVTFDGSLHVGGAVLYDTGADRSGDTGIYVSEFSVPAEYMAPYVPTVVYPGIDNTGWYFPILAGYGYNGERKFIYATYEILYVDGYANTTYKVWVNSVVACYIYFNEATAAFTTSPPEMAAHYDLYSTPGDPLYPRFNATMVHPVAVTNNVVVFGTWTKADSHYGNPVPHYGFTTGLCAVSLEGNILNLDAEELRLFSGNERTFWHVNAYSDWAQDMNIRNREAYTADPIRAGISWNPISREFSVENEVDPTYNDPTNLTWTWLGTSWGYAPATALVGTGFVGTRKKL